MKVRKGFVSNSSSSSFILPLKYLEQEQLNKIIDHAHEGKKLGLPYTDYEWTIEIDPPNLTGHTWMDNFDMEEFLEKIGVDLTKITWLESSGMYMDWDNKDES